MKPRGGFTLTELLITLSAGSAITVLAVGMLHRSMQLTMMARRGAAEHHTIARLATQFRADVRRARQVQLDSDQQLQIWQPPYGNVRYQAENPNCIRTIVMSADNEGGTVGHEDFQLQPGGRIRFELLEQPQRVVMIVSRGNVAQAQLDQQPHADAEPIVPIAESLRIEAVVGAVDGLIQTQAEE